MSDKICEIRIGSLSKCAHESKFRLPESSTALCAFSKPIEILITGKTTVGSPPINERNIKVFVGKELEWQDSNITVNNFRSIWPDILEILTNFRDEYSSLLYISGDIRHDRILSTVFPFIPIEMDNIYISEIKNTTPNPFSLDARICFEYQYDSFCKFVGPKGFQYTLGVMFIMGLIVHKSSINQFLDIDFTDINNLEKTLLNDNVFCWWLPDRDLEAINIWHRELSAEELLIPIKEMIENKHNFSVTVFD